MTNQVAITMLKNLEQSLDDYCELNDEGKTAFSMAISALELFGNSEQLPSTHSKLEKNSPELDNKNGELISRQDAINAIKEYERDSTCPLDYIRIIKKVPSVHPDVADRNVGKWIYGESEIGNDGYYCSVCGNFVPWKYDEYDIDFIKEFLFCNKCGADMGEGDAE